MDARRVRFIANAVITVYCLLMVAGRLLTFSWSVHRLLWGGLALTVTLLDLYFLTRSLFHQPKNIDTTPAGFFLGVAGSLGFGLSAAVVTYPVAAIPYAAAVREAGSLVALLPYPFILWALLCLRDCLTVLPEAHGLVAHGIYRYSRHPLYMCYIVWALANIMMFPSWPMAVVSLGHIAALVFRLRREERLLLTTFPAYREYYRRTGLVGSFRLLPD